MRFARGSGEPHGRLFGKRHLERLELVALAAGEDRLLVALVAGAAVAVAEVVVVRVGRHLLGLLRKGGVGAPVAGEALGLARSLGGALLVAALALHAARDVVLGKRLGGVRGLAFAALTSSVSLLELDAAFLIDEFKFSRAGASFACSVVVMVAGIFCALSFGPLADSKFLGKNVFDWFDFLTSNLFLPIGGLAVALLAGVFCWPRVKGAITATENVPPALLALFRVLLVVACPALVIAVLVTGII